MATAAAIHEGLIRPGLVAELESFHAPDLRASSYYLSVGSRRAVDREALRRELKRALARDRQRIDQMDLGHEARQSLRRDLEQVEELAPKVIDERRTLGLACFVASASGYARALRLPWPVRDRAFFEDHFVVWPLQQILDQSERYAIVLTDKDDARLFLYFLDQIEEVDTIRDEIPGRVRYPDPTREREYNHKHIEAFHHHFERAAEAALHLFQREPFEHLIIGGLWETLPEFEGRLHRYLRDRVVARWDVDAQHISAPEVQERARQEEERSLQGQARDIWKAIQDHRPQRGALGPEEVFSALWGRRVQSQLVDPDAARPGARCTNCGRLTLNDGPCVECGGAVAPVPDVDEEAVHEAIEQDAHVRYWKDPALAGADSIAALRRF